MPATNRTGRSRPYELGQIRESFGAVITYCPGLPVSEMTTLAKPSAAIEAAINGKEVAEGIREACTVTSMMKTAS